MGGKPNALFSFAQRLGYSLKDMPSDEYSVEVIVTKCTDDDVMDNTHFLALLEDQAGVNFHTVPVNVTASKFSRARSCNALTERACVSTNCYFTMIDVDLEISVDFFKNMVTYLTSNKVIYYPILFSEYDPTAVRAAETVFGKLEPYDHHRGMWRETGFGIYAIRGTAVRDLRIQKRVSSKWGGEDVELRNLVQERGFDLIREREPGLIHKWHDKICTSDFVEADYLARCQYARYMVSGSEIIREIRSESPDFFDYLVFLPEGPKRSAKKGLEWVAFAQASYEQQNGNGGVEEDDRSSD